MKSDPPRLSADSALGSLLADARTDRVDAEGRARLWQSIETASASVAMGAAGGVAAKGAFAKLAALGASKIGIASIGVLVLAGASVAVVMSRARSTPSVSSAVAAPDTVATTVLAAPIAPDLPPLPTATAITAPLASARPALVRVAPSAHVEPVATNAIPTLAEGRMLLDARAAISTSPAHALELTATHASTFPSSPLAAERESIAIDALAHLGRCAEVRARSAHFRAAFPASPYAAIVQRAEAGCSN